MRLGARAWWLLATMVSFAIGGLVESDLTWREKRAERELREEIEGVNRFVDAGVILKTVVSDPRGQKLLPDVPPMRIVNVQSFGGIIDTAAEQPYVCGPSADPLIWFCSPDQERIVIHRDDEPLGQIAHGSEGGGKTTALAQWHYFRWLELLGEGRWIGQFAPTLKRLGLVHKEMRALWRPTWGKYVVRRDFEGYEMCDGTMIMFQHTHKQSASQGSPAQGANLSAAARDEMQDIVERHADIQSRGRSSKNGRYKQLGTATAKDDSGWRDLRDQLLRSGKWAKRSLSIFRSPFVDQAFLEEIRGTISQREFDRRYGNPITGEVDDPRPERAVYFGWDRKRNLTPRPRIATDVTKAILTDYPSFTRPGAATTLLCTHDPGVIFNTTEIARLLVFPRYVLNKKTGRHGNKLVPTWAVVGELQTEQTTAHAHARQLVALLKDRFHIEGPGQSKAAVFVDPHGKGETDTDYETVYGAFQAEGLDPFNPAPVSGWIRRSQRVEMMNRLLAGTAEDEVEIVDGTEYAIPRLVVCLEENGEPCAPVLVKALESLEKKPGDKNAEGTHTKDRSDQTHAPASLAYGLWPFEREAVTLKTIERALAEARRIG